MEHMRALEGQRRKEEVIKWRPFLNLQCCYLASLKRRWVYSRHGEMKWLKKVPFEAEVYCIMVDRIVFLRASFSRIPNMCQILDSGL